MLDYTKYENKLPMYGRKASYATEEEFKAARSAYYGESSRLDRLFRYDLEEEYGVPHDHPKAEKLWMMAWDYGHSSGYSSIENYYAELSELVV